jgi:hypothetical protein
VRPTVVVRKALDPRFAVPHGKPRRLKGSLAVKLNPPKRNITTAYRGLIRRSK